MAHSLRHAAFAAGVFAITAGAAHAGMVKMNLIGANTPGGGGPFKATKNPGMVNEKMFLTFCVESNEGINNNVTYNSAIETSAVGGGTGGGNPDPLDPLTAFLYASFMNGDLAADTSFVDDSGALTAGLDDVEVLQQLIWWIEQENPGVGPAAGGLHKELYDYAVANSTGSIGKVRVLRLFDKVTGDDRQDQLIIIPMPAPVGLAGVGLLGLGMIRRRR